MNSRVELMMHLETGRRVRSNHLESWAMQSFPVAFLVDQPVIRLGEHQNPPNWSFGHAQPECPSLLLWADSQAPVRRCHQGAEPRKPAYRVSTPPPPTLWTTWANKANYFLRHPRCQEMLYLPHCLRLSFIKPMEQWPDEAAPLYDQEIDILAETRCWWCIVMWSQSLWYYVLRPQTRHEGVGGAS
jgi:hypothetical protein